MEKIRDNLFLSVCMVILLAFIISAIFAPFLSPHSPYDTDIYRRLLPPFWEANGSTQYLLGTDGLGRDVLSRLIYGARISLTVGMGAVLISAFLGTFIGLCAGFFGGVIDQILMRLTDIQLGFPFFMFTIVLLTVLEPSLLTIIIVLGVSLWVSYARVIRAMVLSLRTQEFVLAAKVLGASSFRIIRKYLLPLIFSQVLVLATLQFADVILIEGSLSFLGIGIQPPTPSWGTMLMEGRPYFSVQGSLALLPGIAMLVSVLALARIADSLRGIFGI